MLPVIIGWFRGFADELTVRKSKDLKCLLKKINGNGFSLGAQSKYEIKNSKKTRITA